MALRGVRTALSFLTTLPVPAPQPFEPADLGRATPHYPLAGYVVGGPVAVVLWLPVALPVGVRAALALLLWLLLTGMLHLDGLVDSADALLAPVPPHRRLEILRDVRVGAFGMGVGVTVLLLQWSVLAGAPPWWSPVVAAVAARFVVTGPLTLVPAARPDGLGAAENVDEEEEEEGDAADAVQHPVQHARIALVEGDAARLLGGVLTGDVIGALVMVCEVAALLTYVVA